MNKLAVFAILLLMAGVLLVRLATQNKSSTDGQAGRAYTESEDGELMPIDLSKKEGGTLAPSETEMATLIGDDEDWLTKFELTERSGKQLHSEQLKGQPYVAGFFYSVCPSICVRQNEKTQQLQEMFKGQAVRFVSISCDPEVDQPSVLSQYAKKFNADKDQWLFLTGDMTYIRRVGAEVFLQPVARRSHTEKFVLMDAEGKQVGFYTWSDPGQWQALQADLKRLIAAGGTFPADEK